MNDLCSYTLAWTWCYIYSGNFLSDVRVRNGFLLNTRFPIQFFFFIQLSTSSRTYILIVFFLIQLNLSFAFPAFQSICTSFKKSQRILVMVPSRNVSRHNLHSAIRAQHEKGKKCEEKEITATTKKYRISGTSSS